MASDRQPSLCLPLMLFFILSLASWVVWAPQAAAALGYDIPAAPLTSPLNALAVWAPGLAAIITCVLIAGRAGPGSLFRPLRAWRVGVGWYAFVLLLPVAQWAGALGLDRLFGRTYQLGTSPVWAALGPQAAAMLPILVVFALPSALGEELGWRGFALPKLQTRYSALTASIILGLFWGLWHVPTWIAQKQTEASFPAALLMVVSTVPVAVLFTWIYNNTGGSLLPVWLFHASIAITNYFTPALPSHTHTLLAWAIAIIIVAAGGPARWCPRHTGIPRQSWPSSPR